MIGDVEVQLRADGSTPYKYRAIHGSSGDLVRFLYAGEEDTAKASDLLIRLGYTMAVQAQPELDPGSLTEEDFVAWCGQFGPLDLLLAAPEFQRFYTGQAVTSSTAKKKDI